MSDQPADAIVEAIFIAAPPQRVFAALLEPAQVMAWWGAGGSYRCTEFAADPRVGGAWRCAGPDGRGGRFTVHGEILALDPPWRLEWSWIASWTGALRTWVRWELSAEGAGTRVRLTHGGFAAQPDAAQNYRGWPRLLAALAAHLEAQG